MRSRVASRWASVRAVGLYGMGRSESRFRASRNPSGYAPLVASVARWFLRLLCLVALVLFAALAVVFVGVTVDQFGTKQYVVDSVAGLPPVYILSALLVLPCLAFVAGFWMLLDRQLQGGARATGLVAGADADAATEVGASTACGAGAGPWPRRRTRRIL